MKLFGEASLHSALCVSGRANLTGSMFCFGLCVWHMAYGCMMIADSTGWWPVRSFAFLVAGQIHFCGRVILAPSKHPLPFLGCGPQTVVGESFQLLANTLSCSWVVGHRKLCEKGHAVVVVIEMPVTCCGHAAL